jgi:hypothetical protein
VSSNNFYNIATGGFNSNSYDGMSEEAKRIRNKKLSDAVKGEKNYFYNKHFTQEKHPLWGKHHSEASK